MAKDIKLDPGFEEVPLDEGFEEVPLNKSLGQKIANAPEQLKNYAAERLNATAQNAGQTAEDALKGYTQGATLGFADELGGATATGLDYGQRLLNKLGLAGKSPGQISEELKAQGVTGDVGPSSAAEIYRQGQQETKADFEKAKERSPWAYGGAELAGGMVTGSKALGSLKSAQNDKKLLEILNSQGYGSAAKELGKRVGLEALNAAPVGAVAGAGYSEGKLIGATPEEQEQLLADTGKGAAFGSALAGGAKIVSEAAPILAKKAGEGIDEFVKDHPFLRQTKKAFNLGEEGVPLRGESNKDLLDLADKNVTKDIADQLYGGKNKLGKTLEKTVQDATESGKTIEPSSELISNASDIGQVAADKPQLLGRQGTAELNNNLQKLAAGQATPQEAYALRKQLKDIAQNPDVPFEIRSTFKRFNDSLATGIEDQVPGFKDALKDYKDYSTTLEKFPMKGLQKSEQSQYGNVDKDKFMDLMNARIQEGGKLGTANKDIRSGFNAVTQGFEENPELAQKAGIDINKIKQTVENQGDVSSVWQGIHGYEPHSGLGKHIGWLDTGMAKSYGISHLAGKGSALIGKMAKWPSDQILKAGIKLQGGKAKFLGDALVEAVQNGDQVKKNAAIFAILQNPIARADLKSELDAQDQENQ